MAFSKPQVRRTLGGDASSASSSSDKVCSTAIFSGSARDEAWRCGGCRKSLDEKSNCLECDGCRSWVCIKCAKIPVHSYQFIQKKLQNDNFKFLCKICKGKFDDAFSCPPDCPPGLDLPPPVLADHQVPAAGGSCVMSVPVAVNLDGVSVASDDVAVKSKGADAGVAQVTATVEQVRQLVLLELDRAMEERQEREKRKCNVVAFGIKEDGKRDKEKIRKLFRAMRIAPVSVVRFYRVGKKKEGVENQRPLLVSLSSVHEKREVVRAAPGLAHVRGYESVFVRGDVSKERRQEMRVNRAPRGGHLAAPVSGLGGPILVGHGDAAARLDSRGGPLVGSVRPPLSRRKSE